MCGPFSPAVLCLAARTLQTSNPQPYTLHPQFSTLNPELYTLQGHLAHKKQRPPRTLQYDYAQDFMAVLRGGGAGSYERGTPVPPQVRDAGREAPLGSSHHPGVDLRANLKSISHRCHLFERACVWELTKETIHLPMGCLQGGLCFSPHTF